MIKSKIYGYLKSLFTKRSYYFTCSVCGNKINSFNKLPISYLKNMDKYGFIHNIFMFETINIFQYTCPECKANDRDRLYALYFNKYLIPEIINVDFKILDIAPSKPLKKFLFKYFVNLDYRSADLYMEDVHDQLDITNMKIYKDSSYDFFICSHVLEHIPDDMAAISELYRVTKHGGKGIVMAPIMLNLKFDLEDPKNPNEEESWKYFGQNDHVRMYSKSGFVKKMKSVGFKMYELGIDQFGSEVFKKNGIHPRSVLYVVEK